MHPIKEILNARSETAKPGIYSACTANFRVIEAVCERAKETGTAALVEATANQVNQFGGYTGMRPADYARAVKETAKRAGLPESTLILGGDHLGPLIWQNKPEKEAMEKSHALVREYVLAGFTKIHIDTSMHLASDDQNARLPDAVIARRGAALALTAERAFSEYQRKNPEAAHPVYCIGSEVPIPGGAQKAESGVCVTTPEDFRACVTAFRNAFEAAGIGGAWEHVVGVIVQPGVEFGDDSVIPYDRGAAGALTSALKEYPGLVFEGHSTDYQTKISLREMVEDGIAILKVGPGLTFAYREGMLALAQIEKAILPMHPGLKASEYAETLERVMVSEPKHWQKYYRGTEGEKAFKRIFSFSDRVRYYCANPDVRAAEARLIENLRKTGIPMSALSQYMPIQYTRVREGYLSADPEALVRDRVKNTIDEYLYAVNR